MDYAFLALIGYVLFVVIIAGGLLVLIYCDERERDPPPPPLVRPMSANHACTRQGICLCQREHTNPLLCGHAVHGPMGRFTPKE